MNEQQLIQLALETRQNAYVPYSGFKVGAALLGTSGNVYTGCNVECASLGGTNCAERTAVFKAVSEGETRFSAIAVTGDPSHYTFPCGICRQVLVEFGKDLKVIVAKTSDDYKIFNIEELLPHAFTPEDLEKTPCKENENDF